MTKAVAWIAGVACLVTAFILDWRAAGLMFVAAYLNNTLRKDGE